jgi:hypothetical protein
MQITSTTLFSDLFSQSPLPLQGVERLALQLCFLLGQGPTWEAFRTAAMAAPTPTQQALEGWLQNHWNQLSRNLALPDYEHQVLDSLRAQLEAGTISITGFSTEAGLQFTRSTEDQ